MPYVCALGALLLIYGANKGHVGNIPGISHNVCTWLSFVVTRYQLIFMYNI